MDTLSAPVLLLIFNRPDLTRQTFEAIRRARPPRLFIASDGPRKDQPDDEALCQEARDATQRVDWECEVHRLNRNENLGCRRAVSSAISWFFDQVEEGIILEDDCLPDLSFFPFCTALLERYRDSEKIGVISGDHFQEHSCGNSYYFTRYPNCWGWATWRRVWQNYDANIPSWNGDAASLQPYIKRHHVRRYFAGRFNAVKWKNKNSWAFGLCHLCLSRQLYCINPAKNLVANIGFDERATHTRVKGDTRVPAAASLGFPLSHPSSIEIDEKADFETETLVFRISPSVLASLGKRIRKFCTFLTRAIFLHAPLTAPEKEQRTRNSDPSRSLSENPPPRFRRLNQ